MRVFICWSEDRSKVVAETLRGWLRKVIQQLEPFLSTQDIRTGKRWSLEIASQLGETKFGILCLTRENLDSRWLNFEAGALSKTIDDKTFVCPYLIGGLEPAEVPDPLGQFQSNSADKHGTLKLLKTINSALTDKKLEEVVLNETFEKFWPDLEKTLKNLPAVTGEEKPKRKVEDMVEEILDTVRGLAFIKQSYEERLSRLIRHPSVAQFLYQATKQATTVSDLLNLEDDLKKTEGQGLEHALSQALNKEAIKALREELKKKAEMP